MILSSQPALILYRLIRLRTYIYYLKTHKIDAFIALSLFCIQIKEFIMTAIVETILIISFFVLVMARELYRMYTDD